MSDPVPALLDEIQFGVFTADLRAHELRKHGTRVKLQERPFQLLAILLERPGAVVTRDELRSRLWPDGTFVDFDHSISSAVRKLRDALGDSASTPRYVETVGRRGYRFTCPVTRNPSTHVLSIASAVQQQRGQRETETGKTAALTATTPVVQTSRGGGARR